MTANFPGIGQSLDWYAEQAGFAQNDLKTKIGSLDGSVQHQAEKNSCFDGFNSGSQQQDMKPSSINDPNLQ